MFIVNRHTISIKPMTLFTQTFFIAGVNHPNGKKVIFKSILLVNLQFGDKMLHFRLPMLIYRVFYITRQRKY